jgi:hypothetical protein
MSAPPTSSKSEQKRRKRRSRTSRSASRIGRFWREWRIEIMIALLIVLAVFLLVERMSIRQTLYTGLVRFLSQLDKLISRVGQGLVGFVRGTTLSDLVAYVLLVIVLALATWRTRHRLITHPKLTEIVCPQCGSDLARIPRRQRDRLLNLVIPIRRYQCTNRDCRWRGRRIYRSQPQ